MFKQIVTAFTVSLLYFGLLNAAPQIIRNGNVCYLSNTVVLKLTHIPVTDAFGNINASALFPYEVTALGITSAKQTFPSGTTASPLDYFITVEFSDNSDPTVLLKKFFKYQHISAAEPKFVYETIFTPNDASYSSQYHLPRINAAAAWDVTQGDTSVVIGIIDSGVDWDHPDLSANMKWNYNEIPGNNIDDDNNGFVDDFRGWDFGGDIGIPDNNPMEDQPDHGTHVAGISSAVTNNSTGIASIGFKSKLLAVKTSQNNNRNPFGQPYIMFGYEGINYAVKRGAKIINCSWGGGGYSILGQSVIKYALSQGSLVICAAGNDNSAGAFYPASYDGVISVASTDASDRKSSFSNYGMTVDISAPGSSILSTWQNDTYINNSGTSMASPLAAGCAALIAARFPNFTPKQIGEQLRATSDNIDNLNTSYTQMLGRGRINAQKAVTATNSFAVRSEDIIFSDAGTGDGDGIFEPDEIINISMKVRNYLTATAALTIGLESRSIYGSVLQGTKVVGSMATLDSLVSTGYLFTFRITAATPANSQLNFLLNFIDGTNQDYQWISVVVNPTFAMQNANNIAVTVTSNGRIGFNDFPNNLQGNGFKYLNKANNLYEGALMLGTSATKVMNTARGATGSAQDNHFTIVQPFILKTPGTVADQEGSAVFNDNGAGANKIGVTVKQRTYSFTASSEANYVVMRYDITNTSGALINNLFAGLFADWDMVDGSGADDLAMWDTTGQFGYVYHVNGEPTHFVGIAAGGATPKGYYAILNNGGDGGFSIYDGFSTSEKFTSLSGGLAKPRAGADDVSHVVSSGPYSLAVNDTLSLGFILAAGDSRQALAQSVASGRAKLQYILTGVEKETFPVTDFHIEQNYPNPFNPSTVLRFRLPASSDVSLRIYNTLGELVQTAVQQVYTAGNHEVTFDGKNLVSGIYIARIQANGYSQSIKMILQK